MLRKCAIIYHTEHCVVFVAKQLIILNITDIVLRSNNLPRVIEDEDFGKKGYFSLSSDDEHMNIIYTRILTNTMRLF